MKPTIVDNVLDALQLIDGNVLLVNPSIIDSRFPWAKWNQPITLLKLSSLLKNEHKLDVRLFDFIFPNKNGRVSRRTPPIKLAGGENETTLFWYGKSINQFDEYLESLISLEWEPTTVIIDTLTSFWWESIPFIGNSIKNIFPESRIMLIGNYPKSEPEHAIRNCHNLDVIVKSALSLSDYSSDITLYLPEQPRFLALDVKSPNAINDIVNATNTGITRFSFFNDSIFKDSDTYLAPILEAVSTLGLNIFFHIICGAEIEDFPYSNPEMLGKVKIADLHVEPVYTPDGIVDDIKYTEFLKACEAAKIIEKETNGWRPSYRMDLSGFTWLGRVDDSIEKIIWNILKLVQLLGMAIPKPYAPYPETEDYVRIRENSDPILPQEYSPHRHLASRINGISPDEYADIYRLSALLNYKVRSNTFDFLGESYLNSIIRNSFRSRRWQLV